MSYRIYLSPIVFDDTRINPDTGEPLPPQQYALIKVLEGSLSCRSPIAIDVANQGRAKLAWAICLVKANDWTVIDADSRCLHLSVDVLDAPLPQPVRVQLRQRGYLTNQEANALTTIRDAVEVLIRKHWPDATAEQIARLYPGLAE